VSLIGCDFKQSGCNGGPGQLAWSCCDSGSSIAVCILHILVETATAMGAVLWEGCGSIAQNGTGLACPESNSNPRSDFGCLWHLFSSASLVSRDLVHCWAVSQFQVSAIMPCSVLWAFSRMWLNFFFCIWYPRSVLAMDPQQMFCFHTFACPFLLVQSSEEIKIPEIP
jgi:hypothetical protein